MTKVKFLKDENGVFAFFPEINYRKYNKSGKIKKCISANLNEGGYNEDFIDKLERANPSEYMPLLNELQGLGYNNLHVL